MTTLHSSANLTHRSMMCVVPSIGEAPLVGSLRPFTFDRLRFLSRVADTCGDAGRFRLGPVRAVLLNSPELVSSALIEQEDAFDKGAIFRHLPRAILGNGLLFSEGFLHDTRRKLLAPTFGPRAIACYSDTIGSVAGQAVQSWHDGASLDLDIEMGKLALSILNHLLFSENVFSAGDALGRLIVAPGRSVHNLGLGILMLSLGLPLPGSIRVHRAIMSSRARIEQLIRERRHCDPLPDDVVSAIMQAQDRDGASMRDQDVRDEVLTLFLAGQRNTTDALAWCFTLLATHSEVYARVQREVDGALNGRAPAYDDLAWLPFTLQVCKEVLRIYPPAYIIGRTARKRVKVGPYELSAGDIAFISPYTMHRRPDYYPNPSQFDPERFAPENEAMLPRYAYVPFGLGPRVCIGNHLTLLAMQVVLITLAQRVNLALLPSQWIEPEIVFTLRPKRGTSVIVRRRN